MRSRQVLVALGLAFITVTAAAQTGLQSGLQRQYFDDSVRPQDDLYRHVNGKWLAETPIPADRPVYGTFVALADQTETQLHGLVEGLVAQPTRQPNTPAQQIGDLYQTFMDQASIEKRGADPIRSRLAEIDAVRTPEEFAALLGRLSLVDIPGPIGEAVNADVKDPTINVLYLDQAGTALPDRDYYLKDDAKFVQIRAKYVEYLTKVFTLVGRPRAAVDAKAVLDLETELARLQWTNVQNRDPVKTYNRYTIARIRQEMPGFDWMAWAAPQGIDRQDHWIIAQPSFFVGFAALVPKTPLATWKAWLAAQVITSDARLLSTPFYDALFDFFGRTLSGTPAPRERWKRAIQLINGSMGEPLGRLYVAKHFPPAAKARMQTMIDNLLEAYRQSIGSVDWMSPPTRQAALAKLDKFTSKIAYPNKWRDYTGLRIVPGDLVGDVERANRFESDYLLAKLGKPVDREEWEMTPQTVNAYYDPSKNQIVFPAAILQAPFFDMTADDASNYGAIGAVIGHEIGHGFDDEGRQFDGDGRLRDWWTPADEAAFNRRTQKLIDQYNAYSPLPGLHGNGKLTLGENIGDLGGLSIAYKAWKIALAGRPSPVIDGIPGNQRFFMAWAQAWRGKARDAYLQQQVLADPHAWNEFRVDGPVSNIQAFYDAFNVKPGDKLYRDPADRVSIW